MPFETEEDELIELFSKFGPVDDCKLVVDKETGHSRGTAFVKFKDVSSTDAAVSASEDTDSKEEGIKFNGRRLFIVKAVTRGKVKEIEKEKKDAKKEPKDKRNIALATEGVIFPNSEAAKELSEADMKKREKAWAEKKAKLKNQNYFVSKTRLVVNVPSSRLYICLSLLGKASHKLSTVSTCGVSYTFIDSGYHLFASEKYTV